MLNVERIFFLGMRNLLTTAKKKNIEKKSSQKKKF